MTQIKNIDQLRDKVLDVFEQLSSGEIDVMHASAIAKLSETVISGLKTQMEYARMTDAKPYLPFLGDSQNIIEAKVKKKLLT